MRVFFIKSAHRKSRSGFAVLMVLVTIVIMIMLYMIDIKAIFKPSRTPVKKEDISKERPWRHESYIAQGDESFIKLPQPPRPTLDEAFDLTAAVRREDSQRGELTLRFNTDGTVAGSWTCQYSHDENLDYFFEADSAGNVAVSQIYSRDGSTDESMLYFITKGSYSQTIYKRQTSQETVTKGTVYITGWLDPDYSAFGNITITTDRKWTVIYDWQSAALEDD